MTNTFKIVITASDKATATVRKVKDSIAQFTKPIRDIRASVGALGRELGIDKLTAGLSRMSQAARKVAGTALKVVGAIAAVAGVGSIAALAAMTREWAYAGAEVLRTSAIIGIGVDRLQALRGAAAALGLPVEALDNGLKSLGDTMENALFGRDQSALVMMNRLGIAMHKTKDGSVDTARALEDVANAVQRAAPQGAQVQGLIARTFGVEALLPMLQKGARGIREYEAAVRKSGAVMGGPALRQAQAFQYQLAMLKLSATGVGNSIMGTLVPAIAPLVSGLTDWLSANKDIIAQNVKSYLDDTFAAVKRITGGVNDVVKGTVGWKNAALILTALLAGRLLAAVVGLVAPVALFGAKVAFLAFTGLPALATEAAIAADAIGASGLARAFLALGVAIEATPIGWILTGLGALLVILRQIDEAKKRAQEGGKGYAGGLNVTPANMPGGRVGRGGSRKAINTGAAAQAMAFFQQQGWSKAQAAGIVGNMAFESGMNADQAEIGGGPGFGLEQWGRRRQQNFKRFTGKDIHNSTLQDQLRFAQFELTQGEERVAGAAIRGQTTASGAASAALYNLERPLNPLASQASRQGLAEALAGSGGKPDAGGKHVVEVVIKGAPPGTTAAVKSSSGGAVKPAVKVDFAMSELSTP